jgi:hypothetical protein
MAMGASLPGRLRNTSLPKSRALLPLFEAVVNAIQATEDKQYSRFEQPLIEVRIIRGQQMSFSFDSGPQSPYVEPVTGFAISDNGVGFDDKNMDSFKTLDSEHKSEKGCRGVGRLMWLKAFDEVQVNSCYLDDKGVLTERRFTFTAAKGISSVPLRPKNEQSHTGTSVQLLGFKALYQQTAAKGTLPIAKAILEHCLWYFVRPDGVPKISVTDGSDSVDLKSLYDKSILASSKTKEIIVKGRKFDLTHLKLRPSSRQNPELNWCAANRLVFSENLSGKVPGLYGKLKDGTHEFMYACFLQSEFLDISVRPERTGFGIPDTTEDALDSDTPSMTDIRSAVLTAVGQHLHDSLQEVLDRGRERVENYVNNKAPRYRPIIRYIADDKLSIDPAIGERDLELQLHRHLADFDEELIAEGRKALEEQDMESEEYNDKLKSYLAKVDDVKKSDLAAYVSRRRLILDLLAKMIKADRDGRYVREDMIHNLIMPMRTTSDDPSNTSSNLWIIDERLAFHSYLASDKTIRSMPFTGSESTREPDIVMFNVHDGVHDGPFLASEEKRAPFASIVVVEIKRPMRNDAGDREDKDPVSQALQYLNEVRNGNVTTAAGRPIPNPDQIPGFCYIIADLTPTVHVRCKMANLRITPDGLSYFGYNESFGAYIEVISFDLLLRAAHQRNRAFFDQLGLPVD